MESQNELNEDCLLLNLPNLVLDQILDLLTQSDVLTLRLTCKGTRRWAEDKTLEKIQMNVKSKTVFSHLLQSSTNWSNIYFLYEESIRHSQLPLFVLQYSSTITTLRFSRNMESSTMIKIISSCSSLKMLTLDHLDGSELMRLDQKKQAQFSSAFSNLTHLGIREISCGEKRDLEAQYFINRILAVCAKSLKTLVIPFLTYSPFSPIPLIIERNMSQGQTAANTPTDVLLVLPMIGILEDRINAPVLESIIIVPESRSSLSDSALFCLTLMCYNRKLNLFYDNFSESDLKLGRLNYCANTGVNSIHMSEIASKIMAVMASTTDPLLQYEFSNLRKLVVQFSTFHIEQDVFVVQNFPQLITLHVDFKMRKPLTIASINVRCTKVKRMGMFLEGLFDRPRPSVKNLKIANHWVMERIVNLSVHKVVGSFYNLRRLILVGFNGDWDYFEGIWRGLRLLQRIQLDKVPGLNDKALLGKDWTRPAILELTDLRELKITRAGRITDLSYIIALSQMRLTRFYHEPKYLSDVTFEGYKALALGDFSKTVKFLDVGNKPDFGQTSLNGLREYLQSFQSLQRSEKKRILKKFREMKWKSYIFLK